MLDRDDNPQYSIEELMISAIAAELRDGELGFVGLGTAARAYTLAVGIPIAAARLAQMTHAPGFTIYWSNLLSPVLDGIPEVTLQDTYTRWPAAASPIDVGYKVDMVASSRFDVSFESAPQVDRFGNLNITQIGEPGTDPKVRLVGCLAQTEHLAFIRRPIIVTDLSRRGFVERVDFVTSRGHVRDGVTRDDLGLPGPGPELCVTDKAIFDFATPDRSMRLRSLHPDVSLEDVLDLMSFRPALPERVETTAVPSARTLNLIRNQIDPHGVLTPGRRDSVPT